MHTYLAMLIESLDKKIAILDQIAAFDEEQLNILGGETLNHDAFNKSIDDKLALTKQLDKLDEGFEATYDRIRDEVLTNREQYKPEITRLQEQISTITDKNVKIQAMEARIRNGVDAYGKRESSKLRQRRSSNMAVQNYYANMRKLNVVDSQFMDKKK